MVTNHLAFSKNEKCNVITVLINLKIFLQYINIFNICNHAKEHKKCVRTL